MAVLGYEEKIKSITLQIHMLLQELKDRMYSDTCEAEWYAKHSSYESLGNNNIAIRTALAAYLTRVADIREIANELYYTLKKDQQDIEGEIWNRINKWEEEHSNEE